MWNVFLFSESAGKKEWIWRARSWNHENENAYMSYTAKYVKLLIKYLLIWLVSIHSFSFLSSSVFFIKMGFHFATLLQSIFCYNQTDNCKMSIKNCVYSFNLFLSLPLSKTTSFVESSVCDYVIRTIFVLDFDVHVKHNINAFSANQNSHAFWSNKAYIKSLVTHTRGLSIHIKYVHVIRQTRDDRRQAGEKQIY